jgi:hypothetical protein
MKLRRGRGEQGSRKTRAMRCVVAACVFLAACGGKDQQPTHQSAPTNPSPLSEDAMSHSKEPAADLPAIERVAPGGTDAADWNAAYEVLIETMRPVWSQLEPTSIKLSPAQAPDGATIPFFIAQTLGRSGGTTVGHLLVTDGAVVDTGASPAALTAYLHGLGFPAKPRSRYHLAQLLMYYDVLPENWAVSGYDWAQVDDYYKDAGGKPITVDYAKGGAVVTFQRSVYPGGGRGESEAEPVPHRLQVEFDPKAAISVRTSVLENGAWKFVP